MSDSWMARETAEAFVKRLNLYRHSLMVPIHQFVSAEYERRGLTMEGMSQRKIVDVAYQYLVVAKSVYPDFEIDDELLTKIRSIFC